MLKCEIDECTPIFCVDFLKPLLLMTDANVIRETLKQVDFLIPACIEVANQSANIGEAEDAMIIIQKNCLTAINSTPVIINGREKNVNQSYNYGKANEVLSAVVNRIIQSIKVV